MGLFWMGSRTTGEKNHVRGDKKEEDGEMSLCPGWIYSARLGVKFEKKR